jgi:outer membrane protein assembly factor BamE
MSTSAMRITTFPRLVLLAVLVLTSGCLYRMPIQQGNMLNPDLVSQLESGMTRKQVLFLLGTPMVPNGFNTDRWDYYFFLRAASGKTIESKHLTVWFKGENVDRIEGDAVEATAALKKAAAG